MTFLRWAARATGRQLLFADERARQQAERTILHGSVHRLAPDVAVRAVLATTSLTAVIDAKTIRISATAALAPGRIT